MSKNKLKLYKTINSKKTLFTEVKQEFNRNQDNFNKTFNFEEFVPKNECTSYSFGNEKIEQKAYICLKCDKKGKFFICDFCYKNCHKKCHNSSKNDKIIYLKNEFLKIQRFSCFCGVYLKHTLNNFEEIRKVSCTMMKLDQILNIPPYHCITHNSIICCKKSVHIFKG
jgi:hypothetical protein